MEKGGKECHLSSYGVSNTSLEEVFLELAEDDEESKNDISEVNCTDRPKIMPMNQQEYLGTLSQVSLLIHKRYTIQRRDLKGLFFKVVLPVVLICCVLMILLIELPIEGTPIELSAELYNTSGENIFIKSMLINCFQC